MPVTPIPRLFKYLSGNRWEYRYLPTLGCSVRLPILISALLFASVANAATIKLFYYENGQRGWKGGFKTMQRCEQAAKSNRLSPSQYYCSTSQDYDLERRLEWRP